jgi:hypothetical protein
LIFEAVSPLPVVCDGSHPQVRERGFFYIYDHLGWEGASYALVPHVPSIAATQFLLNNGCDVNVRDRHGETGPFIFWIIVA